MDALAGVLVHGVQPKGDAFEIRNSDLAGRSTIQAAVEVGEQAILVLLRPNLAVLSTVR